MHFCNPAKPRAPVNDEDVERVRDFLTQHCAMVLSKPKLTSPAVIQMNIGFGRGGGNIQIYTTKLGRTGENCRINVGTKELVMPVRVSLLKSAWFHDALEGQGGPYSKITAIFQPEGKVLLPPLTPNMAIEDLTDVITAVAKKLGNASLEAMRQYLKDCKVYENEVAKFTLDEVFAANSTVKKKKRGERD